MKKRTGDAVFKNRSLIIAVDLGACFIKYAYFVKPQEQKDLNNMYTNDLAVHYHKIPANILFNSDLKFDSIGEEAEKQYIELILHKHEHAWYYFEKFQSEIYKTKEINRGLKLTAANGKHFPARIVYSEIFNHIKYHILQETVCVSTPEYSVKWLMIDKTKSDNAYRHFIRESLQLNSKNCDELIFIDDTDAVVSYVETYRTMSGHPVKYGSHQRSNHASQSPVIILNLGGSRSSSTKCDYNSVSDSFRHFESKELINSSGIQVDNAFLDLLLNIFPPSIWLKFRACHQDDYIDVLGKFETLKRLIPTDKDGYMDLEIPASLLDILKRDKQTSLEELALRCEIESKYLKTIGGILKISVGRLHKMYKPAADTIVEHVKEILKDENLNQGSNVTLILIGGFSESGVLQSMVKKSFSDTQVHVPTGAEFCELKGCLAIDQTYLHNKNFVNYSNALMMRRANPFIKEDKVPKQLEVYAVLDIGSTYSGCAYALNSDCTHGRLPAANTIKWIGGNDIFWPKTPTTLLIKTIEVKSIIPKPENLSTSNRNSKGNKRQNGYQNHVSFDDDYYDVLEIDDETQGYSNANTHKSDDSDSIPEDDRDVTTHLTEEKLEERSKTILDMENFYFGFEAEDEHYKFEDPNSYRYFPKFLTQITNLTSETKVKDSFGAEMLALDLYSLVILFMKRKIEQIVLFNKRLPVRKNNFKWIIISPSTWSNDAMKTISEAAIKAGLQEDQFRLVPDMTAVALYCTIAFTEDVQNIKRNEDVLILNLGGGHVDTAVMVHDNGKRHLICSREQISGDAMIEEGFNEYLTKQFGRKALKQIYKTSDYLRTLRSFSKTLDSVARINSTPRIYAPTAFRNINAQTDKIMIENEEFSKIFYNYIDQIIEHIEALLNDETGDDRHVGCVFVVGGLAVTHRQIRDGLSDFIDEIRVCVPGEAVTCAMIGGIMCCYKEEFNSFNIIQSDSVPEPESEIDNGDNVNNSNTVTNLEVEHHSPPPYSLIGSRPEHRHSRRNNTRSASSRVTTLSFEDPPSYSSLGQSSNHVQGHKKEDHATPSHFYHHGHGAFGSKSSFNNLTAGKDLRHGSRLADDHLPSNTDNHFHNTSANQSSPQIRQRSRVHPTNIHRTHSIPREHSEQSQPLPDNGQSSCCLIL